MTSTADGASIADAAVAASTSARQTWLLLAPIAFGALLFGAVYPWAYVPLMTAVTGIGAYGWATAAPRHRQTFRPIAWGIFAVLAVVLLQLVPLPQGWLALVSPRSDAAAQQYDLAYAASVAAGGPVWHPISIAPGNTADGAAMFAALGMFFAGATGLVPRLRVTAMIRRLAALGLVLAVFGIVQKATFNGRYYWVWTPIESQGNGFGPFINRNHFAGWMLMTAGLAAGYLCSLIRSQPGRRRRGWRDRITSLASAQANRLLFTCCALSVMALSIVWTMSRSGIAGFAVATSLLAAVAIVRFHGSRRTMTVAALFAFVLFALAWRGLDTMADWYSRTSTLEWRVQLWRDTAAIIRDFPWFGTGLNTYGVSTLLYPMTDRTWHAMEAHSDYVQIVSEGGAALGLAAAYLIWQVGRAIHAAFARPQAASTYWIRVGATVGLVGIAVQELTDFSLQMPGNAVLAVVLAAIAVHRPRRRRTPPPRIASTHAEPTASAELDSAV
jgi:O-antigen ligase